MHRNTAHPWPALLVLILASLACGPQKTIVVGGDVSCNLSYFSKGFVYRCACPMDGSTSAAADFTTRELQEIDSSTIRSAACMDYNRQHSSPQPAATEPPTEASTEASAPPTEAATEAAPLKPLLTGTFTTCDNVSRYVNFTLAEDAPPYDPATVKVLFNGVESTCTPAASNSRVLTCIYPPAPNGPPAVIEVFIGDQRVNEFNFDGGTICDPAPAPKNNNDQPPVEPSPTTDPYSNG